MIQFRFSLKGELAKSSVLPSGSEREREAGVEQPHARIISDGKAPGQMENF